MRPAFRFGAAFRLFSTSRRLLSVPLKPQDAAQVVLPRSLIAVHGSDSSKFLNGLITTKPPNFTGTDPAGEGFGDANSNGIAQYCGMLNAKGRVLADLFVYAAHENKTIKQELDIGESTKPNEVYVLDVDSAIEEKVLTSLDFHVLMSDVHITELKNYQVNHVWNDLEELNEAEISAQSTLYTIDKRAEGLGFRCVVPKGRDLELNTEAPIEKADLEQFKLRRYLFGVPEGSKEFIPNKALPLDYCMDYMGGVDFYKGCYLGQELTIRTHHHGNVRKRVMPFVVLGPKDGEISEELYEPKEFSEVVSGANIKDDSPVPNSNQLNAVFGSSPFGSSSSGTSQRPSGQVVASIGNVGLAKLRVDIAGHEFKVGETYIKPLTPFWWPEPEEVPEETTE